MAANETSSHTPTSDGKTIAVLAVKRFDQAKSRLGDGLDGPSRRMLVRAMLLDTLAQVQQCGRLDGLILASSEPELAELAPWAEVCGEQAETSHSAAAAAATARAVERGATSVALLPGDCPLVRAGEIDALLGHARDEQLAVCVVPDLAGSGTNALVLTPPGAIAPSFGPGSRERHLRLAREAGCRAAAHEVPGLSLDIDTFDDCAALADRLAEPGHVALETENALAEILFNRRRLPGGLAR